MEDEQAATVPLRREVALFLGIAFGTTWTLHLTLAGAVDRYEAQDPTTAALYLPGLLGPTVAALVTERLLRGPGAPRRFLARTWRRPTATQLGLAVAVPAAVVVVAGLVGGDAEIGIEPAMAAAQAWVVLGEEPGWRGWLWPRLVDRLGATVGTVLVTAVWATWHLPMFLVPGSPQATDGIVAFAAAIAAWGMVHGVLQSMRRSVLAAMAFHAAANIAVSSVDVDRAARSLAFLAVAAIALVLLARRREPRAGLGTIDRDRLASTAHRRGGPGDILRHDLPGAGRGRSHPAVPPGRR